MNFEKEPTPNKIEQADVLAARKFLSEVYEKELKQDGEVTREIAETNLAHADRVVENASWIADGENLDAEKLKLAAVCHDCGKLHHFMPGGIDTFGHHIEGAKLTRDFLIERGKSYETAKEIGDMILTHSAIPFIKAKRPNIPEPKTPEALALRDADILDQIDIWGFRKIVEIRQNPKSNFYKEDGGSLKKAMSSALSSSRQAIKLLATTTAKKIADAYKTRQDKLVAELQKADVKTLGGFKKVFEKFIEKS